MKYEQLVEAAIEGLKDMDGLNEDWENSPREERLKKSPWNPKFRLDDRSAWTRRDTINARNREKSRKRFNTKQEVGAATNANLFQIIMDKLNRHEDVVSPIDPLVMHPAYEELRHRSYDDKIAEKYLERVENARREMKSWQR